MADSIPLAEHDPSSLELTKKAILDGTYDRKKHISLTALCDDINNTWLHKLCREHCNDVVEAWLENIATEDEKDSLVTLYDDDERNPLLVVFEKEGDRNVILNFIQMFEKTGCLVTDTDRKSWNALHISCHALAENNISAIYERFIVSKITKQIITHKTNKGHTPLRTAVEAGCVNEKIIVLLFQMGALIYTKDVEQKSIFDLATAYSKTDQTHPFVLSALAFNRTFDAITRNYAAKDAIQKLLELKKEEKEHAEKGEEYIETIAMTSVFTRTICPNEGDDDLYVHNNHKLSKCNISNTRICATPNVNGVDKTSIIFVLSPNDPATFKPPQEVVVAIINDTAKMESAGITDFPNLFVELNMEELTNAVKQRKEYDEEPVIVTADASTWDISVQTILPHNYLYSKLSPDVHFWTNEAAKGHLEKEKNAENPDEKKIKMISEVVEESEDELNKHTVKFTTLFMSVVVSIHLTRASTEKSRSTSDMLEKTV